MMESSAGSALQATMPTRRRVVVSWIETIVITVAIPGIAYAVNPDDPFLLETSFPWVILAPILIGLRYGFSHGFASALALIAVLGASWNLELIPMPDFPTALSVGLLLGGMVTGEFRDYWTRSLHRVDAMFAHQQIRLDEFSRVYHLLKASHDRLEQQVAGASVSLRTSLLSIREQMVISEFQQDVPLGGFGERILRIFSEYGGVQMAAAYQVTGPSGVDLSPAARLGNPPLLSGSNPLVFETLRTGQTISVRAGDEPAADDLLASIPLIDVNGQVWGIVTVNEIPFVDFHHRTLDLLTIIGGYIGDILSDAMKSAGDGNGDQSVAADAFSCHLERCLLNVRRFQLPAGLVTISITKQRLFSSVLKLMQLQSRGLDQIWVPGKAAQSNVIYALLPFTDAKGMSDYSDRFECLLQERLGLTLIQAGVTIHDRVLTTKHTATELVADIERLTKHPVKETLTKNECHSMGNAA